MFTDMVGYTALTQSNEERAMEVLQRHNRLLRPFFPKFHGREVKAIGDSFLVEFESALDALRCASEIQSYLRDYNFSSKDEWKINLRVGIHLGDVIHREGDVYGDAVNIASRIEPLADPGGVVVSEQVYDQVRNKSELEFVSMGEKALKNVSSPVGVYAVHLNPTGVQQGEARSESRRVAVLPFVSMSPDPNDEFFADGLTEELIDRLCQVKELAVIARTSVMNYKNKEKNASQIGKELRAGTLVEGSIRKSGNRIRVTAQLIRASTEEHLWSSRYDRDLEDIFAVQTDIAENVAGALKLKLVDETRAGAPEVDVEAYTLYLKGTQLLKDGGEQNARRAQTLFEEAIKRSPGFSRAYSGLSLATIVVALEEKDFGETGGKAEAAARKATELDPGSAEAHVAMAWAHSAYDRFDDSRTELEKALEINPGLADVQGALGAHHVLFGRYSEGFECLRKAFSLDPLSLRAGTEYAGALRIGGRVPEAMEVLEKLKNLHPTSPFPVLGMAWCYGQTRQFPKMEEALDEARRIDPQNYLVRVGLGWLCGETGRRDAAEEYAQSFRDSPRPMRLMATVAIRTGMGDMDAAFEDLMKQAEDHSWYTYVASDPLYERLHRDPRISEFRRKVGLD